LAQVSWLGLSHNPIDQSPNLQLRTRVMQAWQLCCASFVVFHLCAAHVHGDGLSADVGAQIADVIYEAAQSTSVGAGHQHAVDGLLQKAFAHELLHTDETVVSMSSPEEILKRRQLQSDQDDICDRNWAHTCPDGWIPLQEFQCSAPLSYKGPCKHLQSFASTNAVDKHVFSSVCKTPWPCRDECDHGRDYDKLCPEDWAYIGNGFCESRGNYNATCSSLYNFHDMSSADKQELGLACGIKWPCKTHCSANYNKPCPYEWTEITASPGFCLAPPTYSGDCEYSVNTTELTTDEKVEFAQKCSVEFPCDRVGMNAAASAGRSVPGTTPESAHARHGPIAFHEAHIVDGTRVNASKIMEKTAVPIEETTLRGYGIFSSSRPRAMTTRL